MVERNIRHAKIFKMLLVNKQNTHTVSTSPLYLTVKVIHFYGVCLFNSEDDGTTSNQNSHMNVQPGPYRKNMLGYRNNLIHGTLISALELCLLTYEPNQLSLILQNTKLCWNP